VGRNLTVEFRNGIYFAFAICSGDIQGFYFTLEAGNIDYAMAVAAIALDRMGTRRFERGWERGWDIFSGPEQ